MNMVAIHLSNGNVGKVHRLRNFAQYECGMSVYESDVDTIAHSTCIKCNR